MANLAYKNKEKICLRSFHPSHSVVAFGEMAFDYVKNDIKAESPVPMFVCYGKLFKNYAKVLLVGVELNRATFIHCIDEYVQPEGMSAPYNITAIDYEGNEYKRIARNCQGPSAKYVDYQEYLEQASALTYGKIGEANAMHIDAVKCYEVVVAHSRQVMGYDY